MKKVNLFLLCFLLLICTACKMGLDSIKRSTELEFITIDLDETRKLYAVNDVFNKESVKIIGHYSDGTTKEENSLIAEFYGFNSSKEQKEQPITVLFNGKQTVFNIEIGEKSEEYILIKNFPKKLFYIQKKLTISDLKKDNGLDGLEVELYYNDGTSIKLSNNDYKVELETPEVRLPSSVKYRQTRVFVKRNDLPWAYFDIYLLSSDTNAINTSLSKGPDCQLFFSGEEIDYYGMKIKNTIFYTKTVFWIFDNSKSYEIYINDGNCYIDKRTVDPSFGESFIATAKINDKVITCTLGVDNHIFSHVKIDCDKIYHVGEEVNFSKDLKFYAVDRSGVESLIQGDSLNNLKYVVQKETLQSYSYETSTCVNIPTKFDTFGYNIVTFYYEYNDLRTGNINIKDWDEPFIVHDPILNKIDVKNTNITVSLSVNKDTIKNAVDWNIWGYYSNDPTGFKVKIENCTFDIREIPKKEDFGEGIVTLPGKVYILYKINKDFWADTTITINFKKDD